MRNTYKILAAKTSGKRTLGRSWHRCKDNINMDLKEIGCKSFDWIQLAKDRV
jgi:hypothetical protein